MEGNDPAEPLTLHELYDGYVSACGELRIVPMPPSDLLALLQVLLERTAATLH